MTKNNKKKITAKEKCQLRLASLKKALKAFEEVHSEYLKNPNSHINIMALIQSFEFSFELSWVALKYFIQYTEVKDIQYARDIIKAAFNRSIIADGPLWIDMLEDRNKLSHVYDSAMAQKIIKRISSKYLKEIKHFYQVLKKEV